MNHSSIGKESIHAFLFSLGLLFSFSPYFLWQMGSYEFLLVITFIVFSFSFFRNVNVKSICSFYLLFSLVFIFKVAQGASPAGALYFSTSIACLSLLNRSSLFEIFKIFKVLLSTLVIIGLLVWVIQFIMRDFSLFFMGYISPENIPNQLKAEAGTSYAIYPFSTRIVNFTIEGFYRFQSVFDEPGYLGTVCGLTFSASRGKLDSLSDKIIFIGGVFSFSLAFYLLTLAYVILCSVFELRKLLFFLCLISLSGILIILVDDLRLLFEHLILNRLSLNEDGKIFGYNRSTEVLNDNFNYYIYKSSLWQKIFGIQGYENSGSASIKKLPVQSGVLGILLYVTILGTAISVFKTYFNRYFFAFISVFILSIIQRPDVINLGYIFLLVVGVTHYKEYLESNK